MISPVTTHSRRARLIAVVVAFFSMFVLMPTSSASAAAPTCDAASFTVNGEFDIDGYLACLAGAGAPGIDAPVTGGTGLPSAGSDVAQIVALAVGLLIIGAGISLSSARRRRSLSV
jgi:LPXTG-motif cell wall-anchored protein